MRSTHHGSTVDELPEGRLISDAFSRTFSWYLVQNPASLHFGHYLSPGIGLRTRPPARIQLADGFSVTEKHYIGILYARSLFGACQVCSGQAGILPHAAGGKHTPGFAPRVLRALVDDILPMWTLFGIELVLLCGQQHCLLPGKEFSCLERQIRRRRANSRKY